MNNRLLENMTAMLCRCGSAQRKSEGRKIQKSNAGGAAKSLPGP
jgi:CDGSH-type Zn-finger protein